MEDGRIVIRAVIDNGEVKVGLAETEATVTKSANNLKKILSTIGLGALGAKATQLAIKTAKEIADQTEKVMTKLKGASTLYQGVAVDQERLVAGLSKIATATGENLETLGQSVYDALSAGVKPTEDMADVLNVVSKSAQLAKGGFTDTSTALSATLKVMNAYKMDLSEIDKVQGILMQTQNRGITTVDELGQALAQVVPTASSFGVSFENVGSALAEMTKQGTNTRVATTQLNAIIAELGKNGTTASKNLKASAESAGLSATSFTEMMAEGMNLAEVLDLMRQYAEDNGLSMVDMFSSIDAGKASLQLVGQNVAGFSEDMEAMGESAGTVQEAFEKTVSPSEKLASAWQTLAVSIGTKLKPEMDGIRTILADTILKMAGQKTASENLATAIDTVKKASEDYKTAQDKARTSTDLTSKAMQAQSRANFILALKDMSDAYNKNSDATQESLANILRWEAGITNATAKVSEKFNLWLNQNDLYNTEENYQKFLDEVYDDTVHMDMTMRTVVKNSLNTIDENNENLRKERQLMSAEATLADQSIRSLAQAVKDNLLSIDDISIWNKDLAGSVQTMIPILEKEASALNDLGNAGEGDGGSGGLEETKTDLELLSEAITEMEKKYAGLDKATEQTGESFYTLSDKLKEMTDLYVEYAGKGVDPAEEAMDDLWKKITELSGEAGLEDLASEINTAIGEYYALANSGEEVAEGLVSQQDLLTSLEGIYQKWLKQGVSPANGLMQSLAVSIKNLREEMKPQEDLLKDLSDSLAETAKKYEALQSAGEVAGASLYDEEEHLKDLKATYTEFLLKGLSPASDEMKNLKGDIDALNAKIESQKKKVDEAQKAWADWGKTAIKTATNDITKAMGQAIADLGNKDALLAEQNEALAKSISDIAKVEGDMAVVEAELQDARSKGDEAEILKGEQKLEQLRQQKEAMEAQKKTIEATQKSIKSGERAWKDFGRASMEALASVLEGLGGQLSAMAISTYPNFAQMALSAGGAVSAFAMAGLLRSYAGQFATGGIVGGSSYSGDKMIASVNSGELIMNIAQQDSLARALESAVTLAEMQAGGAGAVTVNLAGAYIYGLDSEDVGRAIYENIENLKHEGVI